MVDQRDDNGDPAQELAPLGIALLSGLMGVVGWRRLRA